MGRHNKIFRGPVEMDRPYSEERVVTADTAPGTLVIVNNTTDQFVPHNDAGGRGSFFVLNEDFISQQDTDTNIRAGDIGVAYYPYEKYRFAALLATGNNVSRGQALASNGTGQLRVAQAGEEVLFYAMETYNNDTGSNQLLRVRPGAGEL